MCVAYSVNECTAVRITILGASHALSPGALRLSDHRSAQHLLLMSDSWQCRASIFSFPLDPGHIMLSDALWGSFSIQPHRLISMAWPATLSSDWSRGKGRQNIWKPPPLSVIHFSSQLRWHLGTEGGNEMSGDAIGAFTAALRSYTVTGGGGGLYLSSARLQTMTGVFISREIPCCAPLQSLLTIAQTFPHRAELWIQVLHLFSSYRRTVSSFPVSINAHEHLLPYGFNADPLSSRWMWAVSQVYCWTSDYVDYLTSVWIACVSEVSVGAACQLNCNLCTIFLLQFWVQLVKS